MFQKPHGRTLPILCVLSAALALSSSGGVAICYEHPVSWMTLRSHMMMGGMERPSRAARGQRDVSNCFVDSNQISPNDKRHQVVIAGKGKVCYLRLFRAGCRYLDPGQGGVRVAGVEPARHDDGLVTSLLVDGPRSDGNLRRL